MRQLDSAGLIYVMGPSGAGKDALLAFARERVGASAMFAHRYITRAFGDGENHIALTHDEFASRAEHGLFAMHWESLGLRYGVGIELDAWLARGVPVVVNGSRQHALAALARYPDARFVHIDAAPAGWRRGSRDADVKTRDRSKHAFCASPHSSCLPRRASYASTIRACLRRPALVSWASSKKPHGSARHGISRADRMGECPSHP